MVLCAAAPLALSKAATALGYIFSFPWIKNRLKKLTQFPFWSSFFLEQTWRIGETEKNIHEYSCNENSLALHAQIIIQPKKIKLQKANCSSPFSIFVLGFKRRWCSNNN